MISGIGIDIVEISKVRDLLQKYPAKINSIFTLDELTFCKNNRFKKIRRSTPHFLQSGSPPLVVGHRPPCHPLKGHQIMPPNTPNPHIVSYTLKRYSMIFAAKEATLKSLSSGWERGRDLLDIEITPLKRGQFQVNLFQGLEKRAGELQIKELKGSFSFSGDLAIAQVVAMS